MHHRDLLDPPSLARTLKTAATESALHQDTRGNLGPSSSANVRDAAAARAALEVCEKTAALLRAQLTESDQGGTDDTASPPPAKPGRTVERGDADEAAASSSTASEANTSSVRTVRTDGRGCTVSWTKKTHTQQPDGLWSTAVVPCESRPALVDAALAVIDSDVDILARMLDELWREVKKIQIKKPKSFYQF